MPSTQSEPASWVIVSRATGKAIAETFLAHVAAAINTAKYEVVPIHDWLIRVNLAARDSQGVPNA